jgi:flavin-binding protein dodecin
VSENTVYKVIEIAGTSSDSIEAAVNSALATTAETVRNLRWFEVSEVRGAISRGRVGEWQVLLKVGFDVEDQ